MNLLILLTTLTLQFTTIDDSFRYEGDYKKCERLLQEMLTEASSNEEKAEVLWRLSRTLLMIGETETDIKKKREAFNKGIDYAEKAIKENPQSADCYMWHCANIGRECQTHSLMEQAAAVPSMTKDLERILDELGKVDYSEAWQALSEMYWHHPFKSNESAINYARKAATCIPSDELRIQTYLNLAEMLYERDWSKSQRSSHASSNESKFNRKNLSNIERYSYFDGAREKMPWCSTDFWEMSDVEEADAIIRFAKQRYTECTKTTPVDQADYKKLLNIRNK